MALKKLACALRRDVGCLGEMSRFELLPFNNAAVTLLLGGPDAVSWKSGALRFSTSAINLSCGAQGSWRTAYKASPTLTWAPPRMRTCICAANRTRRMSRSARGTFGFAHMQVQSTSCLDQAGKSLTQQFQVSTRSGGGLSLMNHPLDVR
jgi:hypothetical protein